MRHQIRNRHFDRRNYNNEVFNNFIIEQDAVVPEISFSKCVQQFLFIFHLLSSCHAGNLERALWREIFISRATPELHLRVNLCDLNSTSIYIRWFCTVIMTAINHSIITLHILTNTSHTPSDCWQIITAVLLNYPCLCFTIVDICMKMNTERCNFAIT